MRFTCDREKFAAAFHMAASVAPSRSPKPVLENVKLEVETDRATLMSTDLEVGMRLEVLGLDVESPGVVLLPIRQFGAILRESPDAKLYMECDGSRTLIRGERSEFQLPTQKPEEFPTVSRFEEERYHRVPGRLFRELIRRTVFATEPESSRYALGGVLLELSANQIIGVATDGRRLARQQGAAESVGGHETTESTVVPTRAMQLIERALGDSQEDVLLAVCENSLLLKSQRMTIYSRLLEGRYPRWRDVFPRQEGPARVELPVGPLLGAVRQAAIVTSGNRRGVEFQFGEGRLVLATHGAEAGEARIEMPIAYEAPEIVVKLDPRYVIEFLKVLDPEQLVTVQMRDSESAVLCTTTDGYAYIIMPLALD